MPPLAGCPRIRAAKHRRNSDADGDEAEGTGCDQRQGRRGKDVHRRLVCRLGRQGRAGFSGGNRARVKPGHCTACGKCKELCRFDAIDFDGPGNGRVDKTFRIDPIAGADLVLIVTEPTRSGLRVAGRVRYDRAVTDAQIQKQAVVEYRQNGCTEDIRRVWDSVSRKLRKANEGD